MKMCDYGCGQEAKYQFKNGKWCCCETQKSCPNIIKKNSESKKGKKGYWFGKKFSAETRKKLSQSKKGENNVWYGKNHTEETKKKISKKMKGENHPFWNKQLKVETKKKISKANKGKKRSDEVKKNLSNIMKLKYKNGYINPNTGKKISDDVKMKSRIKQLLTIDKIYESYSLFSKIEEMRYEPGKEKERVIQVHCKNHNCKNSKEQGGWFTPTRTQLYERIRQLEKDYGNGGCHFYCCDECKNECPLYHLKSDPFKNNKKNYTNEEYQQFREHVLERDNYECQYCGEKAEHVHHERPQKLEPFYSLDPDYAWSVCKKCHYEKGHQDECNTGVLANTVC